MSDRPKLATPTSSSTGANCRASRRTSAASAPPDDGALLDLLLDWAPEAATRRKILVDNPAELYGFR